MTTIARVSLYGLDIFRSVFRVLQPTEHLPEFQRRKKSQVGPVTYELLITQTRN